MGVTVRIFPKVFYYALAFTYSFVSKEMEMNINIFAKLFLQDFCIAYCTAEYVVEGGNYIFISTSIY